MTTTTALVTGANKGLGRETVRRLAAWGGTCSSRPGTPNAAAAVAELAEEGLDVRFVPLDVTSEESVAAAADTVKREVGRLDVLVNNAGVGGPVSPPADTTAASLRDVFEVNVFGPIRVTNAFLPLLRAAEQPQNRDGVQRDGIVHRGERPTLVRARAAATRLPRVESGAEHDHQPVRPIAGGHPGQRRGPRLHRDRPHRPRRASRR